MGPVVRPVLISLVLLLSAAAPIRARPRLDPRLDPQRLEQLTRYDVLLFSDPAGAGLVRHKAIGIFDASPEDIFRVATSYERYSEYMPRITGSRVLQQGAVEQLVLLEADLPWPLKNVWVQTRFLHDQVIDQAYRVRFEMVRGNMQRYEGSLLIEPFGDGRSAVTYEILAQPDSHIPRAWLQLAAGRGATNFVHFLRARVTFLQRQGQLRQASKAKGGEQEEPAPPESSGE